MNGYEEGIALQAASIYAAQMNPCIRETFCGLAALIVPNTAALPQLGGEQAIGAVELHVQQYIIWELDHSLALMSGLSLTVFPLAAPTAQMLNSAAMQLVARGWETCPPNPALWAISPFAALVPCDRMRVLALLEQLQFDLELLPPPYQHDGGYVKFVVDYLNRAVMFGNYSEWPAYGPTRLDTPVCRRLYGFPIGWRQAGYPGIADGYRAFLGFVLYIERDQGGYQIV